QMEINGHRVDINDRPCLLVVCQDVTEKQNQLRQLQASEAKLKTATSIAKLGYWSLDLNSNTLSWSDEVYEIWGVDRDTFELTYDRFLQTIHPDDQDAFTKEQDASLAGKKIHDFVHRIIRPDNSIRWVHELGRLVKDKNGKAFSFEGTVQDITEQKQEEQRLKLLESVITHTNDAVMITEAEPVHEPGPRILYVNEAFTQMTGYTLEEVIGKTPRMLQGPNSDQEELARLGKALRNRETCEITTINYKKNGEEFWNNFSVSPVADEKGFYTHFIAIERDITEQKQKELEKELLGKISLNFSFENDLLDAAIALCRTLNAYGRFDFVELWLPTLDEKHIQLFAHQPASTKANTFYEYTKEIKSFEKGKGLPGIVWDKNATIFWNEINKEDDLVRIEAAESAGLASAMGIPLVFNEKIVGVLLVASHGELHHLKKYAVLFEYLRQFLGSEINRKKLENDLEHLYDAIPDIICITDLQGRFLKINKAGCDLIGQSEEEILHNTFEKFVHPDDKERSHKDLEKLNKGEKTFGFENRYINKNGNIIWLSWTSNSNLQEGLIYATARNITEEKRLRELNREVSKLAKIGSWEVDLANSTVFWSDMVHELHETDPK
ncbi:MAG: PAS domain S-box protein, partial [Flavobacteriaceae bacterium]